MPRKYKAVIIDGRKLIKTAVSAVLGICLASAFVAGAKVSNVRFDYHFSYP